MPLAEFQRAKIDSLVQKLIAAGMPDSAIQSQVDSMKAAMPDVTKGSTVGQANEPTIPAAQAVSEALPEPSFLSNMIWKHPGTFFATLASLTNPQGQSSLAARLATGIGRTALAGGAGEFAAQQVGQRTGHRPNMSLLQSLERAGLESGIQGTAQGVGNVGTEILSQLGGGVMHTALTRGMSRQDTQKLSHEVDTALKHRIKVGAYMGEPGSKKVWDLIGERGKLVDKIVSDMQARGEMITPSQVAARALKEQDAMLVKQRGYGLEPDEIDFLTKSIHGSFNDVLKDINRGVQTTRLASTPAGAVDIPINTPVEAQAVKREISTRRSKEFDAIKRNQMLPTRPVSKSEMDVEGGIKQTLENIPMPRTRLRMLGTGGRGIKDINQESSQLLALKDALQSAESYKSPYLSRYALPYVVAGAGAGAFGGHDTGDRTRRGVAGALAGAALFQGATSPRILSRLALMLTDPLMQRLLYQQGGRGAAELMRPEDSYKF